MANFGPLSKGQPHSPNVNHHIIQFQHEGHWELHKKVGFLSPVECLVGFEQQNFWYYHNMSTHYATLLTPLPSYYGFCHFLNSENISSWFFFKVDPLQEKENKRTQKWIKMTQ